jgi:hypothetical protein
MCEQHTVCEEKRKRRREEEKKNDDTEYDRLPVIICVNRFNDITHNHVANTSSQT